MKSSAVSALYVDRLGPYPTLVEDWYDQHRDARTYAGERPVICHPPCGPWGRLRHLSRHDDPALAVLAVEQVRRWGGVLEHPAGSLLWERCGLPRPGELPDAFGGQTIQVNQCDWGHPARKPTWLYLVRVQRSLVHWPPRREPTHWIGGFRTGGGRTNRYKRTGSAVPPGIKIASAEMRRRTPPEFARYLVELAATARPSNVVEK